MSALEICILIGAVAIVVFTVVWNVVRRRRGKGSCGDCGSCPYGGACHRSGKKK